MPPDYLSHPVRTITSWRARRDWAHEQHGRVATVRIAVITVIDDEFAAVQAVLGADHYLEASYFADSGRRHPDVVIAQIGEMGNVGSSGFTRDVIEELRPEVVILTGIAGGAVNANGTHRQDVDLGDVFLPHFVHYGDLRKLDQTKGDQKRYNPHDHPSHRTLQTAKACKMRNPDWHQAIPITPPQAKPIVRVISEGTLVSGEKVFGDKTHPEQRRLISEYPDAVGVEMEAYGVGRGCYEARSKVDYNPSFLIVRGISDLVTSTGAQESDAEQAAAQQQNQAQRDQWRAYAAAAAATYTARCVAAILERPDRRERQRRST